MKKDVPSALLEMLQPATNASLNLIKPIKSDNILHLVEKDSNSAFYFKVIRYELNNNKFLIEFKPTNSVNILPTSIPVDSDSVRTYLNSWLNILKSYNNLQTIFDDPIIKANQERFEQDFDIVDEDADVASFDLERLLLLDSYLQEVQKRLIDLKDSLPEEQKIVAEEIIEDATILQQELPQTTKRLVIKRLAKIWAKAQKGGLILIKEIFINLVSESIKKLLLGS